MRTMGKLVLVLICMLTAVTASTIYIPSDHVTIQAGIDAAVTGDTVLVQAGTYVENINFSGKDIVVISTEGAKKTIIDGNQNGSVVLFISGETSDAVFDGFTLTGGTGYDGSSVPRMGGGILCYMASSPTLRNLIIMNNTAMGTNSAGGGIMCSLESDAYIEDVIIKDNESYVGGGIASYYSSPTFKNITVSNNDVTESGGGIILQEVGTVTIENALIYKNTADNFGGGIFIYTNANGIFTNVTIADNTASSGGGGFLFLDNASAEIKNSIMWNNGLSSIYFFGSYNRNSVSISFSDIQNGESNIITNNNGTVTWLDGNIDSDPLFTDSANEDYGLLGGSPCIGSAEVGVNMGSDWTQIDILSSVSHTATTANSFHLQQNYPNPFNPVTTLSYTVTEQSDVVIRITDVSGRHIKQWDFKNQNAGNHEFMWDGSDQDNHKVSAGVYLYSLISDNNIQTRKMVYLK